MTLDIALISAIFLGLMGCITFLVKNSNTRDDKYLAAIKARDDMFMAISARESMERQKLYDNMYKALDVIQDLLNDKNNNS